MTHPTDQPLPLPDLIERLRARTFRKVDNIEQAFNEQGNLTQGDALLHEEAAAELASLRAIACDCTTRTSPDGKQVTTCGSGQMDRARDAELARLRAEVEAAMKDAERYRHLRDSRPVLLLTGFFGNGCVNHHITEVDAAIDAALTTRKD